MNEPSAPAEAGPHISQLRRHLMETLADLRDREKPMEPDRARAVAQVASVLVDTAKVEIDYLKATGQDKSGFLETPPDESVAHLGNAGAAGDSGYTQGIVKQLGDGRRQHRMRG